jgi:hypothetical protein
MPCRFGKKINRLKERRNKMYKTITNFLGESEIYSAWELLLDNSEDDERNYVKDARGNIYNLSDFIQSDCAWYDGYMSADNFSQYIIKFNKNNDSVKIYYQYVVYIPDKVAKATSKGS